MAGTDVLGRLRTFSVSVRLSTFCAKLHCAKNEMMWEKMRLWFETAGGESKFKSVTSLHMKDQWRCQCALVNQIYCLLKFFSSPFLLPLPDLVHFQRPNYLQERNPKSLFSLTTFPHEKEKNCRTSFRYSKLCDFPFCFEQNNLSDTVPAWIFLLRLFYLFFFLHSTCKDLI